MPEKEGESFQDVRFFTGKNRNAGTVKNIGEMQGSDLQLKFEKKWSRGLRGERK